MSVLTVAAFFGLAAACAPDLDARMLLVQAQIESHLDTAAVGRNRNGTSDYGLMQINDRNFDLLGIRSVAEAMEPCRNLRAAADLYKTLARYNTGSPVVGITNGYAPKIMAMRASDVTPSPPLQQPPDPAAVPEPLRDAHSPAIDVFIHTKPKPEQKEVKH